MKPNINKLISFTTTKKIFFVIAFFAIISVQNSFTQDSAKQTQLPGLITSYYAIKDALVSSNSAAALAKATEFVTLIKSIDDKSLAQATIDALVKDAEGISDTKDIQHQREHFATLSTNMASLAKAIKLSDQPVFEAYCPMQKSYWLSSEKTIKNPYFGSAMLTCGKVTETINP